MQRRLLCALALLTAVSVWAQTREVQVPIDSAGRTPYMDLRLRDKLSMFRDIPGFREARLYETVDSSFVLEIYFADGRSTVKERRLLDPDSAREFRAQVSRLMLLTGARGLIDQSGRTRLLVGTTVMAVGFWGWAVPAVFRAGDVGGVSLYFVTSGAAFLVPYLATRETSVTEGTTSMALYGATRGIYWGLLFSDALTDGDNSARGKLASALTGSVGGTLIGYLIADHDRLTWGRAAMINTGGDLGLLWGNGAAYLSGLTGHDHSGDDEQGAAAYTTIGCGAAGFAVGTLLSKQQSYSRGDVSVAKCAITLGAAIPVTVMALGDVEDGRSLVTAGMIGSAFGLAAGHMLTSRRDFTRSQGTMAWLSEFSGILFSTGLAYAISGGDGDGRTYFTAATVGGLAGFTLAYLSFYKTAPEPEWTHVDLNVAPTLISSLRTPRAAAPGLAMTVRF